MPIRSESNENTCSIIIDGEMTISTASALKDKLMEIVNREGIGIGLDLSGVEEIDTAGVQILILLNREALRAGRAVRINAISGPVRSALELYNIQDLSC